jgi:hypothetical protein
MHPRLPHIACAAALAFGAAAAHAGPVTPTSYDMVNGNTGTFQYWDDSYTGAGCLTCDGAALTGGLGDLTDGVIAASNWFVTEAPAGAGPYVGWSNVNPVITFRFASAVTIDSLTLYLDDADGAGGVTAPFSIDVLGSNYAVADPAGSAPFALTIGGLGFSGTELAIRLNRRTEWVFLSEVTFDGGRGGSVPEPGTLALVATALAALGWRRRSS